MQSTKLRKNPKTITQNNSVFQNTEKSNELAKWWNGAYVMQEHGSKRNIKNLVWFLIAILPTIIYGAYINTSKTFSENSKPVGTMKINSINNWLDLYNIYQNEGFEGLMFWSPFALINLLFFLNIDVGFYLIGLFQKSFWLIDPYWSILPFVYGLIYFTHPLAIFSTRSMTALILVFIWGVRLTHSYFRREGWKFGEREDWRYTKMANDFGRPGWYFISFFAVGVAQHPMIVGISLPLYSVTFGPNAASDWNWLDTLGMYHREVCILLSVRNF